MQVEFIHLFNNEMHTTLQDAENGKKSRSQHSPLQQPTTSLVGVSDMHMNHK